MINPVYPTVQLYIDLDNDTLAETDISSRVVSAFECQHGILSYKDTERLSSVGILKFSIDNSDGTYTDSATLVGKVVSIILTLGNTRKQVFYGYITEADVDSGEWGSRRVTVYASDWMNIANKTRVKNIPIATFVTADEAINTLLGITPNPPAYLALDEGYESFPTMFDGALNKTVVFSELDKITKSELGYLYLRFRDNIEGETLVFENYFHRGSTHPLTQIPEDVVTPARLLWRNVSDSGYLKWRDASDSGNIILHSLQEAYFDRTMIDSNWEVGENVINQMSVTNLPRRVDGSDVVLYNLASPIPLGSTQKLTIAGGFTDPNSGDTPITVQSIVTPVATTDYLFTENEDGTGADYTANLLVNLSYGTNGFTTTFKSLGPTGYITFYRIRGKGIYKYDPIETIKDNLESQEEIVKTQVSDSIIREYSGDYNLSKVFADGVVAVNRTPIKVMNTVSFVANASEDLMLAFMYLEQGDKIQIVESNPSHTGNYYIQGIKFRIDVNGVIYFTWYLKEEVETICEPIAVRGNLEGFPATRRNALDFGILPYLANMNYYSYSFWIKRSGDAFGVMVGRSVDIGTGRRGNYFLLRTNGSLYFVSFKTPGDGVWETATNILPSLNVWYHVVVTYNNTTATADPIIYINGTPVTLTETSTPSGTTDNDADCPVILFSNGPNPAIGGQEYELENRNFSLKDVRIYNRMLTQDEVTELYSGEDNYSTVQNGLVFNGIFAPKDNIGDYINDTITDQDLVLDSVYRAAGTPYNENTSNEDYMLYGLDL